MSTHPIDIVSPWVDGSDPVWQADHAKYRASKSADNHPARYREWGLFRYWFRGIEQNASWVRKVHLLTYGHLPAWLEPDHPKLHIVKQPARNICVKRKIYIKLRILLYKC